LAAARERRTSDIGLGAATIRAADRGDRDVSDNLHLTLSDWSLERLDSYKHACEGRKQTLLRLLDLMDEVLWHGTRCITTGKFGRDPDYRASDSDLDDQFEFWRDRGLTPDQTAQLALNVFECIDRMANEMDAGDSMDAAAA
jgi:hypothetical protein